MRHLWILLIILIWIVPLRSDAAVCACYFGDKNDCQAGAVSANALEGECKSVCEKQHTNLKSYKYAESAEFGASLITACLSAHSTANEKPPKTDSVMPKLNVEIPGLTFSPITKFEGELNVNFVGEYIQGVYKFLISLSGFVAVVLILIGGLQWVFGGVSAQQLSSAKTRIKNAVIGLVLLMSVVLILTLVNPRLIEFDPLRVRFVEEIAVEQKDDAGDIDQTTTTTPAGATGKKVPGGQLCSSPENCTKWCNEHPNESEWPDANDKTIDPALTKVIPDMPGIKNPRKSRATAEMIEGLKKAGSIALGKDPNYYIQIQDGFRPLKKQIKLVCDKVKSGNPKSIADIGTIVARPGGSNHGSGMAVDITFYKAGAQIVTSSNAAQANQKYKQGAGILADIMAEAGFVRYAKEIWHFELAGKTTSDCRCKGSAQCPFPASCKF